MGYQMSVTKISSTIYELRDLERNKSDKPRGETFHELKQQFESMIRQEGFGPYQSFSVLENENVNPIEAGANIIAHIAQGDRRGCIKSIDVNDRTKEACAAYSELRANIVIFHEDDDLPEDEYEVYVTNDHHGTTIFSIHATEHYISNGFNISSLFTKGEEQVRSSENIQSLARKVGLPDYEIPVNIA